MGVILSYANPDMDSICSSVAYEYFLKTQGKNFRTVIFGKISSDIKYVFDLAEYQLPNNKYVNGEKVILVDTHHLSQLPHLNSYSDVIEVLDHHSAGDNFPHATIENVDLGAVATLIAEKIFKSNCMTKQIAILLSAAIISNTNKFKAKSTTSRDISVFEKLSKYFHFNDATIEKILELRYDITESSADDLLQQDLKIFDTGGLRFGISQLEIYNATAIVSKIDFYSALKVLRKQAKLDYICLNLVDTKNFVSFVIVEHQKTKDVLNKVFDLTLSDTTKFERVLLRKTDFVPRINQIFGDNK